MRIIIAIVLIGFIYSCDFNKKSNISFVNESQLILEETHDILRNSFILSVMSNVRVINSKLSGLDDDEINKRISKAISFHDATLGILVSLDFVIEEIQLVGIDQDSSLAIFNIELNKYISEIKLLNPNLNKAAIIKKFADRYTILEDRKEKEIYLVEFKNFILTIAIQQIVIFNDKELSYIFEP